MRLNEPAPAGAYFAGWDASGSASANNAAIVGLHHPAGDMLKISKGQIAGQTSCVATEGNQFGCVGSTGNFYMVGWDSGTTQGGSSGSAIFSSDGRYVVGNLYGGSTSCTNRGAMDYYGRFDVSYAQGLKNWLGGQVTPPPSGGGIAALDNIVRILQSLRSN
jgi:lysyl endopeptidase